MQPVKSVYDIELLKELRGDTKKAEFARQLGLTRQYYHNLESGKCYTEIPRELVQKLKDKFDLTAEEVCRLCGIKMK